MTPDDIERPQRIVVVRAFRGSPLDVDCGRGTEFSDPAANHWDVTLWTCRDDEINEIVGYELFTSKPDALKRAKQLAKSLGVNVEIW